MIVYRVSSLHWSVKYLCSVELLFSNNYDGGILTFRFMTYIVQRFSIYFYGTYERGLAVVDITMACDTSI